MPGTTYTRFALGTPQGSFGPVERFLDQHGLPEGRERIARESLAEKYKEIKTLANPGNLNLGIWVVKKKEGKDQGKLRVMKIVGFDEREGRILLREIEILHILKHPNIVSFIDGYIPRNVKEGQAELFLEYCDGGSLQDLLDQYIGYNQKYHYPRHPYENVPEAFIWEVFHSLASALAYLHSGIQHNDRRSPLIADKGWPWILHRDLKPDNVLLKSSSRSSKYPTVVLADFGLATQEHEHKVNAAAEIRHQNCGTSHWQGPEFPSHDRRGEVWTLGAIIMSLCNQYRNGPVSLNGAKDKKSREGIQDIPIVGEYYSTPLKKMIKYALAVEHRPWSPKLLDEIRKDMDKLEPPYEPLPDWALRKR